MRIRQLTADLANQIAAGEVIERPASIVKELLENAQDAGASVINIDVGHGGLNQVKISDNGCGIVADDLPLALAAHATSKISQLSDLYAITSMGFRGEALASIASIARVTISSRPADQAVGMSLDNQSARVQPCARNPGTTIDVRDIFYNAPVRKKFLKPERAEFQAIERVVRCFALGSPDIAISLNHNGQAVLNLPAATDDDTRLARIARVLGKSFVAQSLSIDATHANMRLQGWISDPGLQRSQNDKIWVYLNDRMVKDKLIHHAIRQAYDELLHPGRFPSCLLYLTMNAAEVDVNVHPTKHEVRFQQPRYVHDFIRSRLQTCLQASAPVREYPVDTPAPLRSGRVIREAVAPLSYERASRPVASPDSVSHQVKLNDQFSLIVMDNQAWLVDCNILQQQQRRTALIQTGFPLPTRPLLVPMSLAIACDEASLERIQNHLLLAGLESQAVKPGHLLIRTLPTHCPQLDLKAFVLAVCEREQEGPVTSETLITLLLTHQSLDETADAESLAYFKTRLQEQDVSLFAKPLSLERCRDVFNA